MKLICFYLPQFHETKNNNKWWGKGYTDWVAAKNARPLFKGHNQPRIPLNHNYYDLSEDSASVLLWQCSLAREYGIYGFCIYHYWFAGIKQLEKPAEILLRHPEIEIKYTFSWDSNTWKRNWYSSQFEQEILLQQDYGDEEMWRWHFNDLLPYFMDKRYIKIDNKPVFHIYRAYEISCLPQMMKCWNELAIEQGFDGIYLVAGDAEHREEIAKRNIINAFYNYEPVNAFYESRRKIYGIWTVVCAGIKKKINRLFHLHLFPDKRNAKGIYREICSTCEKTNVKTYLGIFVDYDDTPRRQERGAVYIHNKVRYFEACLKKQIDKSKELGNEFIYINAWNEWGESAYLEPDEDKGYIYLKTIKKVLGEKYENSNYDWRNKK